MKYLDGFWPSPPYCCSVVMEYLDGFWPHNHHFLLMNSLQLLLLSSYNHFLPWQVFFYRCGVFLSTCLVEMRLWRFLSFHEGYWGCWKPWDKSKYTHTFKSLSSQKYKTRKNTNNIFKWMNFPVPDVCCTTAQDLTYAHMYTHPDSDTNERQKQKDIYLLRLSLSIRNHLYWLRGLQAN